MTSDGYCLDCLLIRLLDCLQRQVLIHFQTFLTFVPGEKLNLRIGQASRREVRQHLVTEEVWMDGLGEGKEGFIARDIGKTWTGRYRASCKCR